MAVRILIVDDHEIVREGLRSILSEKPGFELVGEAENGLQAIRMCRETRPDLVVMDISMPEMNGVEATREIKRENPDVKVLALSMHAQKAFVHNILQAGASGYLLKDCLAAEIAAAVSRIMAGKIYICSELAGVVMDAYLDQIQSVESPGGNLSPRERQVIQLLAEGKRTKEIASALFLSPRTVDMYRAKVMKKLRMDNLADLTKFAIREGLTSLD